MPYKEVYDDLQHAQHEHLGVSQGHLLLDMLQVDTVPTAL